MRCKLTYSILLTLALAAPLRAQDKQAEDSKAAQKAEAAKKAELALEIQRLVEELQAVREEQVRTSLDHAQQLEQLRSQVSVLESDKDAIQADLQDRRQKISQLQQQRAQQQQDKAAAQTQVAVAAEAFAELAEQSMNRVAQAVGPDWRRRLAEMRRAGRDLGDERIVKQAEGVRTLLTAVGDEWQPARTVSLANEEIVVEGDRLVHAWVLRFGLVTAAFVSEDGTIAGVSTGDSEQPWKTDLPAETKADIQHMIDIVRKLQPPSLAPLPVLGNPAGDAN